MNKQEILKEARIEFARMGGKAKANKMTPEERVKHAKMMAKAKKALKNKDKVMHS